MRSGESFLFSNITATPAKFAITGGKYLVCVVGTFNAATVTLQRVGPDGSTLVNAGTAISAAGMQTLDLAPGTYQATVSGSPTALYVEVTRINEE